MDGSDGRDATDGSRDGDSNGRNGGDNGSDCSDSDNEGRDVSNGSDSGNNSNGSNGDSVFLRQRGVAAMAVPEAMAGTAERMAGMAVAAPATPVPAACSARMAPTAITCTRA